MQDWRKWKIKEIVKDDKLFPSALKKIRNCPTKLYYRGNWDKQIFEKSIGVVGSRRMTRYGREITEKLVIELVAEKMTIISGFMYGVDTQAHSNCVEYGGRTIAVLGGGLDYLSPTENDKLYSEILNKNGLVISEYETDFRPTLWSFPQRNRIVAGLSSMGVIVVEAGLKSGSLITARLAREMGKSVYAIPGPINSGTSEGTNWLIKENQAKLITGAGDILKRNRQIKIEQEELFDNDLSVLEKRVIGLLKNEGLTIDELAKGLDVTIADMSTTISLMSMKGLIGEENGTIYLIKNG